LPERRRVVRPGKRVGRVLMNVQVGMLLRERSRERRVGGKWKKGGWGVSWMALMLFPRRERCWRLGREVRWCRVDSVVRSLCSSVRVVMVLEGRG
jgi:hypothetical protein